MTDELPGRTEIIESLMFEPSDEKFLDTMLAAFLNPDRVDTPCHFLMQLANFAGELPFSDEDIQHAQEVAQELADLQSNR